MSRKNHKQPGFLYTAEQEELEEKVKRKQKFLTVVFYGYNK